MYQSNRSLNIPPPPPRAYPGHFTSFAAQEGGNLVFPGAGHLITTYVALIPRQWRDKSWRRQALVHWKRKIPDSWWTGWKAQACTSFALYLKVFKNRLYYLRRVRVLSIKPCLHSQLPEHKRSYWKVSRGWGHLITCNRPKMGHLKRFLASGGENLNKNFPKIQMPGRFAGGDV